MMVNPTPFGTQYLGCLRRYAVRKGSVLGGFTLNNIINQEKRRKYSGSMGKIAALFLVLM